MSTFFIYYFSLLLFGALIIMGWWMITRGEKVLLVDGTTEKRGKIFKAWYFFWTKTNGKKAIHYSKENIDSHFDKITKAFTYFGYTKPIETTETGIYFPDSVTDDIIEKVSKHIDIKFDFTINNTFCVPYEAVDKYVFPEWLRDMMAECITCHASFYGSVIYWGVFILLKRFVVTSIFSFTDYVNIALVLSWFSYCFSLSFVLTFLFRKING